MQVLPFIGKKCGSSDEKGPKLGGEPKADNPADRVWGIFVGLLPLK
jgi:hypothetical protein